MTITVKRLREELAAFPDDALCYAYEGEATGIVIVHKDASAFIPCLDGVDPERESPIKPLESWPKATRS